jgi:hypothetical protein
MKDARELVQKLYQMYDNVPHTSYRFKSCPDYKIVTIRKNDGTDATNEMVIFETVERSIRETNRTDVTISLFKRV